MIKRSCLYTALMLALAGTSPVLAQSDARHAVELQAQDLGTALRLLAQQTKLQIVYPADLVQGKRAPAVDDSLTATEALSQLLIGNGLKYEFLHSQTVTLSPIGNPTLGRPGRAGTASTAAITEEEHDPAMSSNPPQKDRLPLSSGSDDRAQDLEGVTVTGTRIRGGTTPSPVIAIGAERIREEGFADLGEVIRSVPQNFSGGQNPGVSSGGFSGAGFANQNVTGGSSLNLRGLGPDATLTLLNGRRMAYSGFVQAVDIGAIPVEAVDRVEIVADGASAIYGSDAVGGVGNVILRRDFDGMAVSTRHGAATDGGLATHEYALTGGTYWNDGGVIATYKHVSVDPIYSSERHYTDHLGSATTIHPGSELRSGLVSGHQRFGNALELRLDAMGSRRDQMYSYDYRGVNRLSPRTTSTLVAPGIDVFLPGDWTLTLGGAWAESEHDEY